MLPRTVSHLGIPGPVEGEAGGVRVGEGSGIEEALIARARRVAIIFRLDC